MNEKENENRTLAVGVVLLKGDEVLLVEHKEGARHETGLYGFPAGRVEEGESLKQTAARELYEETGLRTSVDDLADFRGVPYISSLTLKSGPEDFEYHVFLCKKFDGELRETNETRPQWVKISNVPSLRVLPNIVESIVQAKLFLQR